MSQPDPRLRHLSRVDPVLRRVISAVGPCTLRRRRGMLPYQALLRAVAHQQLNGTAAETILRRFLDLFPGGRYPLPEEILACSPEQLRAVGFSASKVAAILDIAARAQDGLIPDSRAIARLSDADIIERLVQVRGIGRWSVEMLLIFNLGRADVLPVDDFGVRAGFMVAYGLDDMPKPRQLAAHGERWAPYRSIAAWYLWRAWERRPR
jgi:DNA-3-methyladenine glycosylase II